jgi:ectoine hydroxylase-related dioxygenase (phytanoyl-CoA dioxygenase family)
MKSNSKIKDILKRDGFVKVKNILNFNKDLKPIMKDMEFVMDCLIQKFAPKIYKNRALNYDFRKKYTYVSKLNIYDLDQYFNTRLPRDHVKKDSDYFASHSLWNLITNKKILDVVEKILGSEILSSPVQNTRIKQPEKKLPKGSIYDGLSGRTPWHQDAAVLNSKGQKFTDMVTVWIPFTKTTKKNGCMITVKKINKIGLLNHVAGYRGQVEIKDSKLLDKMKHVYLEANVGDVILLHKHSIHCSLPNRSNDFRISADLRYNIAGQPSGREPLPNFYVRSKNKKNLNVQNFKQWLALWEKAKEKCIPRKYAFKYPLPTFKNSKRDLSKLI